MPRYFTDEHEWIDVEGESATVGITDYAQEQLGDIVFVELPSVGTLLDKGGDAAVVEPQLEQLGLAVERIEMTGTD